MLADAQILFDPDTLAYQVKYNLDTVPYLAARYMPFLALDDYGRVTGPTPEATSLANTLIKLTPHPRRYPLFQQRYPGSDSPGRPGPHSAMTRYVEVSVNIPQVSSPFHYHLPPELEGQALAGSLVTVPFGAQTVQGIVLGLIDSPQVPATRPVLAVVDPQPVLTGPQIQLARWLAENTLAPLGACLDAMVPPGLSQHADLLVHLKPEAAVLAEKAPEIPSTLGIPGCPEPAGDARP